MGKRHFSCRVSARASQSLQFISFLLLKVGKEDEDGHPLARDPTGGLPEGMEHWDILPPSEAVFSFSSWSFKRTTLLETHRVSCDLTRFMSKRESPSGWKGPLEIAQSCPKQGSWGRLLRREVPFALLHEKRSHSRAGRAVTEGGSEGTPVTWHPAWAQNAYCHPAMLCL